jgi:hypothetical protein
MVLCRRVDERVASKLRGARVDMIGIDGHEQQSGDILTLHNMKPGESRWLSLTYTLAPGKPGEVLPVAFEEMVGNHAVNGFAIAARLSSWNSVAGENLRFHIGVFSRLAVAGKMAEASQEERAALALLKKRLAQS